MLPKPLPSQQDLLDEFDYNPVTGELRRVGSAKEAGWFEKSNGYAA